MYLQRQTTRSFLFIIPLWIVSVWEMASQVQQERLVSWNIRCTHRTQQRWCHCTTNFMLCILINRFLRSLSIEYGYDYDDVDENGKYTWSFYMTLIYFFLYLECDLIDDIRIPQRPWDERLHSMIVRLKRGTFWQKRKQTLVSRGWIAAKR